MCCGLVVWHSLLPQSGWLLETGGVHLPELVGQRAKNLRRAAGCRNKAKRDNEMKGKSVARLAGIEPATLGFGVQYSIH